VLLWCWWGPARAGGARRVAIATAVTTILLCLPLWLPAPRSMTRMVVLDQLGRPRSTVSVPDRLVAILGSPRSGDPTAADPAALAAAGWTLGAWVAALALTGVVALALTARGSDHLGRWAVALLAAQVGVLLASPPFFGFYPAYVAPAMAITVGAGVAGLGELVRRTTAASAPPSWVPGLARAGGVTVLGIALLPLVAVDAAARVGLPLPAAQLRPLAATGRCVTADRPDMLILLDALGRDLRRDCPVMVDVTGLTYDTERGASTSYVQRRHNPVWQHTLRAYLLSGGTALLGRPGGDGLSRRTAQVLRGLPVLGEGDGYRLYAVPPDRRRTAPKVPEDQAPSLRALLAP